MKRLLRYLKFISLGLITTLILIFAVNQTSTVRDAAVESIIQAYQPELASNELAENPLYLFLQQNEPSPELMAVYVHTISTSDLPKLPPRLDIHKPILAMYRWNQELLKYAETRTENEKLKIFTHLVDINAKLLENRIPMIEFRMFITNLRQTLDWATGKEWTPKANARLKELSQKVTLLLDKREALVKNVLNSERELSFQLVINMDFSNLSLNNLDAKTAPDIDPSMRTQIVKTVGPYFFDRNQTLNMINTRTEALIASAACLQNYTCDKQISETVEENIFTRLRNPVGKGILKILALREQEMAKNQEAFLALEESNKNFAAVL